MHSLVAPVRPTLKSLYPLIPIEAGVTPGKTRSGGSSDQDMSRVPSLWTTTDKPRDWYRSRNLAARALWASIARGWDTFLVELQLDRAEARPSRHHLEVEGC